MEGYQREILAEGGGGREEGGGGRGGSGEEGRRGEGEVERGAWEGVSSVYRGDICPEDEELFGGAAGGGKRD